MDNVKWFLLCVAVPTLIGSAFTMLSYRFEAGHWPSSNIRYAYVALTFASVVVSLLIARATERAFANDPPCDSDSLLGCGAGTVVVSRQRGVVQHQYVPPRPRPRPGD